MYEYGYYSLNKKIPPVAGLPYSLRVHLIRPLINELINAIQRIGVLYEQRKKVGGIMLKVSKGL
jgi:hypothetical protein